MGKPEPVKRQITTVDLGELTGAWRSYCETNQMTLGEGMRQLVGTVLEQSQSVTVNKLPDKSSLQTKAGLVEATDDGPKQRVEIRLARDEMTWLEGRAVAQGFTPTTWLVSLIRSQMTGAAQLGSHELQALMDSTTELRSIEKHLRRISQLQQHGENQQLNLKIEGVEELTQLVREVMVRMANLVLTNSDRWNYRKNIPQQPGR